MTAADGHGSRRILYGRKRGRRLRPGRKDLVERMLPRLEVALPPAPGRLDREALFGPGIQALWLEIGFGAGEHLAAQAEAHPAVGFIGCESYLNGVASLLGLVADKGLDNVRVFADDARLLIDALADASIGRCFLLFPDPWPKQRHHKRRFIAPATLDALARVLRDGGELRVATDDAGYCRWTLSHVLGHGGFEWPARRAEEWRRRPPDWPATRYERKSLAEGRRAVYLRFVRRPRAAAAGAEGADKA